MERMPVLQGIRVLDLGRFIAGPFCGALLADYGADVIRVDKVGGSEDRNLVPVSDRGDGALFLQVNRNKRSLALDIDSDKGREVLHRLVEKSDIVIANMPPRTLQGLGLDYESLRKVRPDVILVASSAFGTAPGMRERLGFDGVGQAASGAVHITGLPEQPMKFMVPVVDFATGIACALGAMMALYERKSSGQGQEVGASLLQTALNFSSGALIEEAVLRLDRQATGNRAPQYAPSDIFRTRDGWIITQVIGPAMFRRWTQLVGRPELLDDPRCRDDVSRGENGEWLGGIMAGWCEQLTRAEALARLEEAKIPAGPVNSPREVLDDPAIREAGAFQQVDYPGTPGPVPLVSPPTTLSRTPPRIERRPPTAGEHTDEILRELGYSAHDVSSLREAGVV
jgi:formyl-CoA transferase